MRILSKIGGFLVYEKVLLGLAVVSSMAMVGEGTNLYLKQDWISLENLIR